MIRHKVDGYEIHGEGELCLIRLGAVGNRRQQNHFGAATVGLGTDLFADGVALQGVDAVGQVEIVRLGRAKRQHRHLVMVLLDDAVVRFGQFPGEHGGRGQGGGFKGQGPGIRGEGRGIRDLR